MIALDPRAALRAVTALALVTVPAWGQAGDHTVQMLGPGTLINDMNIHGDVVGWSSLGGVKAFLVGPGREATFLPLPPGYSSAWAQGINDAGVVVGSTSTGSFPEFGEACAWHPDGAGGFTVELLGQLPGHTQSVAYDVNNRGDIVGVSITPGFQGGPTVWFNAPGGVLDLSALGAPSSPKEINDEGVVVGINGGLFDIDTSAAQPLPPFTGNQTAFQGWAVNDKGEVAGTGFYGGFVLRAASVWTQSSGWQAVSGLFNASSLVQAFDINTAGVTVLEAPQPAAWFPGVGTLALESLLPVSEQDRWTFVTSLGEAVNDRGQIAAIAIDHQTDTSGVVLLSPDTPFVDLGGGTAGSNGVPRLTGEGTLVGGTPFGLTLTQAPPGNLLLLWVAASSSPQAAFGGTLHAFPFTDQFLLAADDSGIFAGQTTWPGGLPAGTQAWFQCLVQEASVPWGLTLSNALVATAP